MIEVKYVVMIFVIILCSTVVINSCAAGYCKDNIPGVCSSSPFCVNKKIGAACRGTGTCTALGKKKVGDCCSCKGGRSPKSSEVPQYKSRFGNPQMLDEFRTEKFYQGKPQYEYNYPKKEYRGYGRPYGGGYGYPYPKTPAKE